MRIRPYILAGGKSSRMGRDKAMLQLEGATLLARTISMLHEVRGLKDGEGKTVVTLCGERDALEGADRTIVDLHPGCGPLGGMEAALVDLRRQDDFEWAFFLPVDMPLLDAPLIDALLDDWTDAIARDTSVLACLVEADGQVQPLVSLVHNNLLDSISEALGKGQFKVAPLLLSAKAVTSSLSTAVPRTAERMTGLDPLPTGCENPKRHENEATTLRGYPHFVNVNTEADLIRVATLLKRLGSNT